MPTAVTHVGAVGLLFVLAGCGQSRRPAPTQARPSHAAAANPDLSGQRGTIRAGTGATLEDAGERPAARDASVATDAEPTMAPSRALSDAGGAAGDAAEEQSTPPPTQETYQPPPLPPLESNASACPPRPPSHGSGCDSVTPGACAYFGEDPERPSESLYHECRCLPEVCTEELELSWSCLSTASQYQQCPSAKPDQLSACADYEGSRCRYPREIECSCQVAGGELRWACDAGARVEEHPSVVSEDTIVAELSDAERQAWCDWLTRDTTPQAAELEPDADGFYPTDTCSAKRERACGIYLPRGYPSSACVDNLTLSQCRAPLAALNDCVLSLITGDEQPTGCGGYITTEGCAGTIVNRGAGQGPGTPRVQSQCQLRVR